jgi:hypothetical protein
VASRSLDKAKAVCQALSQVVAGAELTPVQTRSAPDTAAALAGAQIVIAAGAAGVELMSGDVRVGAPTLAVAIDLNAVPPAGIAGIDVMDKAKERDGVVCYGAIGVGGTKMKIHKAAIQKLFSANDLVMDAEEVYAIGKELGS